MDIASKYDLEALNARNKYLEDQIEAFKTHLDAVPKGLDHEIYPWDIGPIDFNKLMRNLYKVLGVID